MPIKIKKKKKMIHIERRKLNARGYKEEWVAKKEHYKDREIGIWVL